MKSYLLIGIISATLFFAGCTEEEEPRMVRVSFTVLNEASKAPLSNASFSLSTGSGSTFQGTTGADGIIAFTFEAVGETTISLSVSHPSFDETHVSELRVGANETLVRRTLQMSPAFQVVIAPSVLDFGTSTSEISIRLINEGDIDVSYRIIPDASEITINQPTGTIGANRETSVAFVLDRSFLEPGTGAGNIDIVVDELVRDLRLTYSYRVLSPDEINWVDQNEDGLIDIRNIDDLYRMSLEAARDTFLTVQGFELMKTLDFDNAEDYKSDTLQAYLTTESGWLPVGLFNREQFPYAFHGNGKSIHNLYIDRSSAHSALFAYVGPTGSIQDLTVTIKTLRGDDFSGGLVGLNRGTLENCAVSGTVESTGSAVGLLIGRHQEGLVSGCFTEGGVIASGRNVGGLIGLLGTNRDDRWEVINSYANVIVRGNELVGGLIGSTHWGWGVIQACYARGNVLANAERAGGLMGQLDYGTVSACYATGDVSSNRFYVGGLIGENTRTVATSYSTGRVLASSNFGGFIGRNTGSVTARNYWDVTTSEQSSSASSARGLVTQQLQGQTTANGIYITWDPFIWDFGTISQYPALKGMPNGLQAQRN